MQIMIPARILAEIKRYRRTPQNWWTWWETEGGRDESLRKAAAQMWECPLPAAPDGSLPDIKLPITSVRLPMYAMTDPLATLYIGTEVLKKRGHLDVNLPLSALTIFIRGDGVVDGWTKVYHLSLLVADAEGPRKPNNCLDFVVGDIEETSPLHWSRVSAAVLPSLDLMRLQVADTLCVGDGAFLLNVEKGLTHGPNQALNDFRHQGVSVLVCDTDCRLVCAGCGHPSAHSPAQP